MEIIVRKLGVSKDGLSTWMLLNSSVQTSLGMQIMSAFVTVESTTLKEGDKVMLATKEYNAIQWQA